MYIRNCVCKWSFRQWLKTHLIKTLSKRARFSSPQQRRQHWIWSATQPPWLCSFDSINHFKWKVRLYRAHRNSFGMDAFPYSIRCRGRLVCFQCPMQWPKQSQMCARATFIMWNEEWMKCKKEKVNCIPQLSEWRMDEIMCVWAVCYYAQWV